MGSGKPHRLADLAQHVGGKLAGDGEVAISGIASLESAGAGDVSFVTHARFRPALERCKASAVIVPPKLAKATGLPQIVCAECRSTSFRGDRAGRAYRSGC